MAVSVSTQTGELAYSGAWTSVQEILRVLNIGEGKLAKVTETLVEHYQEMVDRDIDAILGELYQIPLRAMNQIQPDGTTKRVFPGDVQRAARYWTAGLLLLNEFQALEQNATDQASQYIQDAQKQIYAMAKPSHKLYGQRRKSGMSRTMPPNFQPSAFIEQNW